MCAQCTPPAHWSRGLLTSPHIRHGRTPLKSWPPDRELLSVSAQKQTRDSDFEPAARRAARKGRRAGTRTGPPRHGGGPCRARGRSNRSSFFFSSTSPAHICINQAATSPRHFTTPHSRLICPRSARRTRPAQCTPPPWPTHRRCGSSRSRRASSSGASLRLSLCLSQLITDSLFLALTRAPPLAPALSPA